MEIIEDRHGRRSTIICSQLPVSNWHQMIEDSTIADALLDRLIHGAHRLEMKGEKANRCEKISNIVSNLVMTNEPNLHPLQ